MKQHQKSGALSAEAIALHATLIEEWAIKDAAGLTTLMVAMQCLDRMHEAQEIIAKEGILAHDRFGQARQHPASVVEKEARSGLLAALKHLNLDLGSLEDAKKQNAKTTKG
jgi:hypothetical protein